MCEKSSGWSRSRFPTTWAWQGIGWSGQRLAVPANHRIVGDAARWTFAPLASPGFRAVSRFVIGTALLPLGWITFETFLRSFGHAALDGAFWRTSELWFFGIGTIPAERIDRK